MQKAEQQKLDEEQKQAYLKHLQLNLKQIEKQQPKVYGAFINDVAIKRAAIEQDPAHKGATLRIVLRVFADTESQLERARDFFGMPDFEEWRNS